MSKPEKITLSKGTLILIPQLNEEKRSIFEEAMIALNHKCQQKKLQDVEPILRQIKDPDLHKMFIAILLLNDTFEYPLSHYEGLDGYYCKTSVTFADSFQQKDKEYVVKLACALMKDIKELYGNDLGDKWEEDTDWRCSIRDHFLHFGFLNSVLLSLYGNVSGEGNELILKSVSWVTVYWQDHHNAPAINSTLSPIIDLFKKPLRWQSRGIAHLKGMIQDLLRGTLSHGLELRLWEHSRTSQTSQEKLFADLVSLFVCLCLYTPIHHTLIDGMLRFITNVLSSVKKPHYYDYLDYKQEHVFYGFPSDTLKEHLQLLNEKVADTDNVQEFALEMIRVILLKKERFNIYFGEVLFELTKDSKSGYRNRLNKRLNKERLAKQLQDKNEKEEEMADKTKGTKEKKKRQKFFEENKKALERLFS